MTVVLAKQREPNVGSTTKVLRPLDIVDTAINNAPIANTDTSHFYLMMILIAIGP